MTLLAIDPSLSCTGWAIFAHNTLLRCGYVTTSPKQDMAERIRIMARGCKVAKPLIEHIVIERPQVYARDRSKGDPNKLGPLWAIAGAVLMQYPKASATLITPATWKGQVAKPIMFARILARLSPKERETFDFGAGFHKDGVPPKTSHAGDVLDAIGIGLHALERLKQ